MTWSDPSAMARAIGGRWLDDRLPSAFDGVSTDTRQELSRTMYVALRGATHDGHAYAADALRGGAAAVLVDENGLATAGGADGLSALGPVLVVDETLAALGRLGAWHRVNLGDTVVIGVTGSCGKTTTKHLLHAVLSRVLTGVVAERSFNNAIGVPLTLLRARPGDDYVVVEIGTNAPGEIGQLADCARPDVAILTCIEAAHLEGFGTIEAIGREKASIFRHVSGARASMIGSQAHRLVPSSMLPENLKIFGFGAHAAVRAKHVEMEPSGGLTRIVLDDGSMFELALRGRHNVSNALAVIGLARELGISDVVINEALRAVDPPSMRFEHHSIGAGLVELTNDAYNANPASMAASLATFFDDASAHRDRRHVLVLGSMLELGSHSAPYHHELGERIMRHHDHHAIGLVVLVGAEMDATAEAMASLGFNGALVRVDSEMNDDACRDVAGLIQAGDRVLLKGSRGNALERLIPVLEKNLDAHGVEHA